MGIPQVPDQVRKAPTLALRAIFSGIGKILLAADRPQPGGSATGPKHAAPSGRAARAASSGRRAGHQWRSLDETGNVRLLSDDEGAERPAVLATGPAGPDGLGEPGDQSSRARALRTRPETVPPAASQPLTGNVPVGASLVVHSLPVPGYDTMSVAAIRARLRSLDVDQLQALLVHERKNAERPEVIAMFERRIEKLESGG